MTESSPTITPSTCPVWCLDKPGHGIGDEYDDGSGDRLHRGPRFGPLEAWATTCADGRPMLYSIDSDGTIDYSTPAALRELARAAEEAARWLEAQAS